jgi:hypothetical protein
MGYIESYDDESVLTGLAAGRRARYGFISDTGGMMNRFVAGSAVFLMGIGVVPVPAQSLPDLQAGSEIRISTRPLAEPAQWTVGEFTEIDPSRSVLRMVAHDHREFSVPMDSLTRLQLRTGTRTMGGTGLGYGILLGLVVGGIWGGLAHEGTNENGDFTQTQAIMLGGGAGLLIGGAAGALIGLFVNVPVWMSIQMR